MEHFESKLRYYIKRKYGQDAANSESSPAPAVILDIQAYAAGEFPQIFAKPSTVTPTAVYAYLLSAAQFSHAFAFWLAVHCELLRSLPATVAADPAELLKLLESVSSEETKRENVVKHKLDIEILDAFTATDASRRKNALSDQLVHAIDAELAAVQNNVYKFGKEHLYRWLAHLFQGADIEEGIVQRAGKQAVENIKAFHGSARYFQAFKENIFASPLILDITRFLTVLMEVSAKYGETRKAMIQMVWELYGSTPGLTLREKIELSYTFHKDFTSAPEIVDSLVYWDALSAGLASEDSVIRKYCMTMVKDLLQCFLADYKDPDKEEISSLWVTFFDIYDTYESYVSHLSKSVWDRVAQLFTHLESTKRGLVPEKNKREFLTNMSRWLKALLLRVHTLENTKLRKYVVKYVLKIGKYPAQLHQYFFTDFMKQLNTPLFYKEGATHRTDNTVEALIPGFVKSLVINSGADKCVAARKLIKGARDYLDNRFALIEVMHGLCLVDGEEKYVGPEELQMMEEIVTQKTREFFISKRYVLAKHMIEVLSRHIDTEKCELKGLWGVFWFIPTPFYVTKEADLIDPRYKAMLGKLLSGFGLDKATKELLAAFAGASTENFVENMRNFKSLCKAFTAIATKEVAFKSSTDPATKKFSENMLELFQKIAHDLFNPYTPVPHLTATLRFFQRFLHAVIKIASDDCIRLFATLLDSTIASSLAQFVTAKLSLLVSPMSITAENKDKLKLFMENRKTVSKLLSHSVFLLHIALDSPSAKLNSLFSFVLSQTESLLAGLSAGKLCSGPALAGVLLVADALLVPYCYTIETRTHKSVSVFEPVFAALPKILPVLTTMAFAEKSFDRTYDPVFKQMITPTDTTRTLFSAQWRLVRSLVVVSALDAALAAKVAQMAHEIVANVRKVALPVTAGEMLQVVFDILILAFEKAHAGKSEMSESETEEFLGTIEECWTEYKQDMNNSHRSTVAALCKLLLHRTVLAHKGVRCSDAYRRLLLDVLVMADKCWLIGRALIGELVPLLVAYPGYVTGLEEILVKIALCQEHRADDNAVVLEALKKKMVYYEEIDFHGAFIRVAMLELFERLALENKAAMIAKGWKNFDVTEDRKSIEATFGPYIELNVALTKVMILMLDSFVARAKKERTAPMTYTGEYRARLRQGQFVTVLVQAYNAQIFNSFFRKNLCEIDPVDLVADKLKAALETNNSPVIRNYMEIATAKFAAEFPEEMLSKLLLPHMTEHKANIQISCMLLEKVKDEKVQRSILAGLTGIIGSHSAFSRTLSQVYLSRNADKLSATHKELLEPFFKYIREDKSAFIIAKKVGKYIETSADMIMTSPINDFGEFLNASCVEQIRTAISSVIMIRADIQGGVSGDHLWKTYPMGPIMACRELKTMLAERPTYERELQEAAERSKNYQRKILPWEKVDESFEDMNARQARRKRHDIILVASLIEKMPNLGGLCRTCEIFNVSTLVVPSIKVIDSLSVSSERWQPVCEVSDKDLEKYLIYQKLKGYRLLGLEQTAKSYMIQKYKFPEKCVLLLGEEKTGIPIQYLRLLDDCVEIPQLGIVRSLNVHVSGAICLWEYTKQISFSDKTA